MIILKVNLGGVLAVEQEGDAPVPRYSYGKTAGLVAFQRVEAEAWDVHFGGTPCDLQARENEKHLFAPIWPKTAFVALCPISPESFVFEADDHIEIV